MTPLSEDLKRRRWLILGVVAVAYVLSFFQRFAPAGIAQDLAAVFQTSAAWLGMLVVTLCAVLGALASWWIKEARCRNIWQPTE